MSDDAHGIPDLYQCSKCLGYFDLDDVCLGSYSLTSDVAEVGATYCQKCLHEVASQPGDAEFMEEMEAELERQGRDPLGGILK